MKKKISVLIITMLLCFSTVFIVNEDFEVEASPGGDGNGEWENETKLDYSFMWEVTENFSNVVHNNELWGEGDNVIRKGRAFGTNGDRWAANYTFNKMDVVFKMDHIYKEEVKDISWESEEWNDFWKYNYKVETLDFNLEIYGDGYPFDNNVPINETFAAPSGMKNNIIEIGNFRKMDYNNSFTNMRVISRDINTWPTPLCNNDHYNVSLSSINYDFDFIGNASYLTINDDIPEIQELNVFLIDEEDGCEEKIENITNASAIILLQNSTIGNESYTANTSNFSSEPLFRAYYSENNNNLSAVINLLKNDTFIITEYLKDKDIVVCSFNHTELCISDDCFIVTPRGKGSTWALNTVALATWNLRPCKFNYRGLIMYDDFDETHVCIGTHRDWPGVTTDEVLQCFYRYVARSPGIQIFCVNQSVGEWLEENCAEENTGVTGYFEQADNDVLAYNVWGNLTIPESPNDEIVIISNRLDGWWGETPGDSGVGGAIALGILKYFTDYNIIPKYNLTFLFTTGEEYAFRGAWHYHHTHPDDNIVRFIGLDQLAFDQEGSLTEILVKDNSTTGDIIRAIVEVSGYTSETGYEAPVRDASEPGLSSVTDCMVFRTRDDCDTITLSKDNTWDYHHRAGMDYSEGDSLKYIDPVDVNMTYNLSWDIVKYYCVNPDCWFTNVTYQTFDSEKDGDTLNDSIRANFTLNTILPHDEVMVELLYNVQGGGSNIFYLNKNYSVNASGRNESIVFSIPDDAAQGGYSLEIRLYNSTAKIDKIVFDDTDYNDSNFSSTYHLYHSFGYTQVGSLCQNINNRIAGSVFTANENGIADNITAFINHAYMDHDPYQCMLYRANDSKLIGNTSEDYTLRDYLDPLPSAAWAVFDFPEPKPNISKGTQYVITCWGGGSYSMLSYDDFSDPRGRYDNETYDGTPPDPANFTNENRLYSIYCSYTAINYGPNITSVNASPDPVGFGMDITISANVTDVDGVDTVKVNIFKPEDDDFGTGAAPSYVMTNYGTGDIYTYVFNDTWQNGQYNYTIWAIDNKGYSNISSQYSFNVSAQATVSVCTVKDEFGNNTFVNVTDPPSPQTQIGYELLDDDKVLRIWNRFDSYYFDTDNGIQLTNHYNKYWSHNVLMLGYYNNDVWNLIYRSDNLNGFNRDIESDDATFVNATLWKDLTYGSYDFRLAIRYHLGVDDTELTVIPYIKNIDNKDIPYVLGFAWEINDIMVDMTSGGDYIEINGTRFDLNETLDLTFSNMTDPVYCWDNTTNETIVCDYVPIPFFYIREDIPDNSSESLYLRWDETLKYKVQVKSRDDQFNAPVTLGIKIGTLDIGQEKYTSIFWHDAADVVYYFNSYDNNLAWSMNPGNMVDSSTSTFASTQTDYDIELCDGNTCSGSDLGTISKVEIRCHGKRSGFGMQTPDILLQPLGVYHVFNPGTSGDWSSWFDITDDPNAPANWTWNDVDNLNCDVIARVLPSYTLYCSKIEVRVTYTSPNYNPVISDPYPVDGATGISVQPVLNITVSDPDGDNMTITWLSNSSGSWQVFGINSSVENGTYHQTMVNASVNGEWWYWNVSVSDGTNVNVSDVFKFYTGFESKIKNTGSTNISGYLLMQLHYLADMNWIVATEAVNETTTRTINSGDILALDTIFNGKDHTAYLINYFGAGTYRVYAAFRDPDGDVLVCDDESLMEDSYQFTVSAS